MNTRVRGLITLVVMLAVAIVACGVLPFVVLPGAGIGVALPVITVPGEVVIPNFIGDIDLTNSIIGTVVTDILLVIFVVAAWRASKGWTKEVPGRFQSWVEWFIGDMFRNFMKGIGGERLHTAPLLWPLVATIFVFLLAGNWIKLVPGFEAVGTMHCAYAGFSGYPIRQGWTENSYTLYVDGVFDAGTPQTEETEEACYAYFHKHEFSRFPVESTAEIQLQVDAAQTALNDAQIELANLIEAQGAELSAEEEDALHDAEEAVAKAERALERQTGRLENAEAIPVLERQLEDVNAQIAALSVAPTAAEEDHGEEAVVEAGEEVVVDPEVQLAALEVEQAELEQSLNAARTQLVYPNATLALSEEDLEAGAIPYIFHITPWLRGIATDMSVAIMLALLAIVAVQIYGVWAQGPAYFEKFINISALGNLGKKPLGLIDFVVGLIEIISEIGKIISLAFRLFGNMFAGGVALIALTFLVAFAVPMVMVGLELIIGTVQALVFAVLTLVFAVQAMESHHGDDHEHADEH